MVQLPRLTRNIDRWANDIQESERAKEVLARTTKELTGINEGLPLLQRDRNRLLEFNVRIAEITRDIRPHRKRLSALDPEGLSRNHELLEGVQSLVKAGLTQGRGRTRRIEAEVLKAVQREAASQAAWVPQEVDDPISISSLVEQYLPLDEQKWLAVISILDAAIQSQELDANVYQAIIDAFREQLDVRI